MSLHRFAIALLVVAHWAHPVSSQLCYTPDGTLSNDRPCSADGGESACCQPGFLCTSNKLCQPAHWHRGVGGNTLKFIRGTCTDKTWKSPECQGHCVKENPGGGEYVMRCGETSSRYCCSAEDCCQRQESQKIDLGEPNTIATAGVFPSTSTTSATTSTPSPSSAQDSTPSSPQGGAPSASGDSDPEPKNGSSSALRIGVGVGVAAGAVAVLSALGLWWCIVKNRRRGRAVHAGHSYNAVSGTKPEYRGFGELDGSKGAAELSNKERAELPGG
ncbi:predicted protein [Coccidioides posadasii str. Silveira]|uniref:Predicted protein n=1 Tax=Coccidioides posadasii (strain RMSCC 757 / Silveira) TaxID=443226 RepID=E9CW49_COCPS|nr:predicted protein [Coccidioides posadasii str. Silveira]